MDYEQGKLFEALLEQQAKSLENQEKILTALEFLVGEKGGIENAKENQGTSKESTTQQKKD